MDLAGGQVFLTQIAPSADPADTTTRPSPATSGNVADAASNAEALAKAIVLLQTKPDDAASNLIVGRDRCFVRGDWPKGLAMLAKGSDAPLKDISLQELKNPADAAGQVKLADAWWAYADTQQGPAKTAVQSHAQDYYRKALPGLKGLARIKAETRLPDNASTVSAGPAPNGAVVDLLKFDDQHRKVLTGNWTTGPDGLRSESWGRILFDYLTPEEYDIKVDYARLSGTGVIGVLCPLQHGEVVWFVGGEGDKFVGFFDKENGDPKNHWRSLTNVTVKTVLTNGERASSTIHVRRDSVEGLFNNKLIAAMPSDGTGHETGETRIAQRYTIGLAVSEKTVIYELKVTKFTTTGTPPSAGADSPQNPGTAPGAANGILPPNPASTGDGSSPLDFRAGPSRMVLFISNGSATGTPFQAIAKDGVKAISKAETAVMLADPNLYGNATVVAWSTNEWRDTPVEAFTDSAMSALQQFVRSGGDLVIFEQYAQTNMGIFDRAFSVKTGGAGSGARIVLPEFAAKVAAAGLTEDMLKEAHFYNSYQNLPTDAVVLVRDNANRDVVAIVPFGKGRLVLMGTNRDASQKKLVDEALDFVYRWKPSATDRTVTPKNPEPKGLFGTP